MGMFRFVWNHGKRLDQKKEAGGKLLISRDSTRFLRDLRPQTNYRHFRNTLGIGKGSKMSSNDVFQSPIHSYLQLPATTLASKIRRLEIGVEELLKVFVDRINVVNASINAVVADRFSEALMEARELDEELREMSQDERDELEDIKPFLGVPFTAKVAFAVRGLPNSGGLVARKDHIAEEDAVVVRRLRQAGAIPIAVSNCSELCMWWESANRVYGRTSNPYNKSQIVGGSSGGEGAIIGAAGSVFGVGSGKTEYCTKCQ